MADKIVAKSIGTTPSEKTNSFATLFGVFFMSGHTEFVIADKSDAAAIADEINPSDRWRGFEGFKYFDSHVLAPLGEILVKLAMSWKDFPNLALGTSALVYDLPPPLLRSISQLSDREIPEISEQWRLRLIAMNERYSAEELEALLRQLRDLASEADAAGKTVLLWLMREE